MSEKVISVEGLEKSYGVNKAVDRLDFEVNSGEIYGLIGPNGSGKTTTMEILSGVLSDFFGKAFIDNLDVRNEIEKVKEKVGYVPESPNLYESLTPIEYFNMVGSIRNIDSTKLRKRVDYFVDAFDLESYMNQYIGSLSFGTKQKVSLTSSFIHNPKVLILDEAMNGLDPKTAKILRGILFKFKDRGKSVIFSSHVLQLAEIICDRIGIIADGKIIAQGTIDELRERSHEENLEDIFLKLTKGEEEVSTVLRALESGMGDDG